VDRWQPSVRTHSEVPVREAKSPADLVRLLGEVGAYGVNFHDNDLIPIDATHQNARCILKEFKKALVDTGIVVPMATTNLFKEPIFKDGAFTSNDSKVRAYALQKTMNAIDLGVELGAKIMSFGAVAKGLKAMPPRIPLPLSNAHAKP
jgi:xylose isomerase